MPLARSNVQAGDLTHDLVGMVVLVIDDRLHGDELASADLDVATGRDTDLREVGEGLQTGMVNGRGEVGDGCSIGHREPILRSVHVAALGTAFQSE